MKNIINRFLVILLLGSTSIHAAKEKRVVNVAVADIRKIPKEIPTEKTYPLLSKNLPNQWTQALYNERLLVEETEEVVEQDKKVKNWIKVRVLGQKKQPQDKRDDLNGKTFKPIIGYIRKDQTIHVDSFSKPQYNIVVKKQWARIKRFRKDQPELEIKKVSLGTKFRTSAHSKRHYKITLPGYNIGKIERDDVNTFTKKIKRTKEQLKQMVVETALTFVTPERHYSNKYTGCDPYCWQGASAFDQGNQKQKTSTDCSGLTFRVLDACGYKVHRDCCDQYPLGKKIAHGKDLEAGDFIFLANNKNNPKKLTHVMIYLGNNKILEMTGTEGIYGSRIVSSKYKLGRNIEKITSEKIEEDINAVVYFADFFGSPELIQAGRDRWLET
jgi:hypothetical protein